MRDLLTATIKPIQEQVYNHIPTQIKEINKKVDQIDQKFDRKFDRLFDLLVDKNQSQNEKQQMPKKEKSL